jgi:translocation and assembly module TamB
MLDLDGLLAGGLVTVRSSTETSGRFRTELEVGFADLVLDKNVLGLGWLESATGSFSGTVRANMFLAGGFEAKGKARLEKARIEVPGYTVGNKGVVKLSFTQSKIVVEMARLGGEGTLIDVTGSVARKGPDLKVSGKADLGLLARFVPEVRHAEGTIQPSVALKGAWKSLGINGKVSLDCTLVDVEGLPFQITDTRGSALFTDAGMVLDASGRIGPGSFSTSGRVVLEGFRPREYDVHLDFNDASLKLGKDLPVGMEGQLLVSGVVGGEALPVLTGDVWITRLRYTKKFQLARIPRFGGAGPVKPVQTFTPGKERLRLDVNLHGTKNLKMVNNVLDVSFALDESQKPFRVVGTDGRPVIIGQVRIRNGTLSWQNRTFEISQGVVDFANQSRIEPEFDIVAEGDVRSWHLVLQAFGTADDFRVVVSSVPPLSDEDVVCLLATEMTCEEARQGLGFVGSYGLAQLLDSFKRLENFGVGSQYNPASGQSEPVVTFKKKLTSKMSVSAVSTIFKNKETGEDQYIKATVAYKVTDHMSVEGSYDTKSLTEGSGFGNVGVDVTWKFEF